MKIHNLQQGGVCLSPSCTPHVRTHHFDAVKFSDLPHADRLEEPFEGPSYGDGGAAFVLCNPQDLIKELMVRQANENAYGQYGVLIRDLHRVKEAGLYIALEG